LTGERAGKGKPLWGLIRRLNWLTGRRALVSGLRKKGRRKKEINGSEILILMRDLSAKIVAKRIDYVISAWVHSRPALCYRQGGYLIGRSTEVEGKCLRRQHS